MRTLVRNISIYAKHQHPGFVVIPQNGHELLTDNGTHSGKPVMSYVKALDGLGQESLFYGYNLDDQITPDAVTRWLTGFLDIGKKTGLSILVTDYCSTRLSVVDATRKNRERGYIPFAASSRNLDRIPTFFNSPVNANHANVTNLKQAKNFLYLVNPGRFESKDSFLQTIKKNGA